MNETVAGLERVHKDRTVKLSFRSIITKKGARQGWCIVSSKRGCQGLPNIVRFLSEQEVARGLFESRIGLMFEVEVGGRTVQVEEDGVVEAEARRVYEDTMNISLYRLNMAAKFAVKLPSSLEALHSGLPARFRRCPQKLVAEDLLKQETLQRFPRPVQEDVRR